MTRGLAVREVERERQRREHVGDANPLGADVGQDSQFHNRNIGAGA